MAITDTISDAPIERLIYEPFKAVAKSNQLLIDQYFNSIMKMAYKSEGIIDKIANGITADAIDTKVRTLDMKLERPVTRDNGTVAQQEIDVKPPLLGLVPINSLMISEATVDLEIEVTTTSTSNSSRDVEVSAGGGWGAFSMNGKVTCHREHTRESNQSAKYSVSVKAEQQETPEGMNKLMDLLASVVEPISAGSVGV
ncbi:hypothetical protein CJF42_19555 [Pseudoalteromonas sp. NBT06-2]|uniref:DUF2589 domain-containing protein n=1 Tax=Pseudoalteromonas sp. NBT06-2 TaxID=2025950 RepID=UPI000BA65571|nr:DUF2589 domain-containing protein [Pseudoalteromonas sp. NBT06-2]PAJ72751.1 hypothetical protein CJF42_19555 [Pseudoalteromonas sp. NBT06-2]